MSHETNPQILQNKQRRTLIACIGGVVMMIGLAYASVPLYDLFCRVTGFGGTTNRALQASQTIGDRVIEIRFDASLNRKMPWAFNPPAEKVALKVGETGLAFYQAKNLTDETITGTATYNVTPQKAGYYFSKIDCFCFTEQVLEPGQSVDMPVTFFIDPEIVNDKEMDDVKTITLSYTFFRSEKSADNKSAEKTLSPKG
ncbi:MAG: cytochrome c oxidase assembly protein [Parvibaculales bacterium]